MLDPTALTVFSKTVVLIYLLVDVISVSLAPQTLLVAFYMYIFLVGILWGCQIAAQPDLADSGWGLRSVHTVQGAGDFLDFQDIVPDLLDKTRAVRWGSNIPAYILGLSRGSGSIGLGVSDMSGIYGSFMADDCKVIEWMDHDGVNFGSQYFVPKDEEGPVFAQWVADSHQDTGVHARVLRARRTTNKQSLVFLVLEGFEVNPKPDKDGKISEWFLTDKRDKTSWVLTTSVRTESNRISRIYSTGGEPTSWMSPSSMLRGIRDNVKSTADMSIPRANVNVVYERIAPLVFIFFNVFNENFFDYSITTATSPRDGPTFPESVLTDLSASWRSRVSLPEYGRRALSNLFGNLGRFEGNLVGRIFPSLQLARQGLVFLADFYGMKDFIYWQYRDSMRR
jgi:hypothetical protein